MRRGILMTMIVGLTLRSHPLDPLDMLKITFDIMVKADTPLNTWIWNTTKVTYIGGLQINKASNVVATKVVPEPTTITLFGIGLLSVLALVRRRR